MLHVLFVGFGGFVVLVIGVALFVLGERKIRGEGVEAMWREQDRERWP